MENKVVIKMLPLTKLVGNNGQIDGVPKNPRFIRDEEYELLLKSIKEDPQMLRLREMWVFKHGNKYVVLNGNQRLRATKELGYTEAPCKIIPSSATRKQLRAYVIKANKHYGQYDYDLLTNQWNEDELSKWGLDMSAWVVSEQDFGGDDTEVNVGDFEERMTLTISLSEEQMTWLKQRLAQENKENYEDALLSILGY